MDIIFQDYKKFGINLLSIAIPIINLLCPIKYSPNGIYDNEYFFLCLMDFLHSGVYWVRYKGFPGHPIKGKYLNSIHQRYVKNDVYKKIHEAVLKKYLSTGREIKLTTQSIDSSFVANKQGIHNLRDKPTPPRQKRKNKQMMNNKKSKYIKNVSRYDNNINNKNIQFNKFNGRKKYIKISRITDSFGVALGTAIIPGNKHDTRTIQETINNIPVNLNTKKNSTHNRYKQKFLADAGYSSKNNKKILIKMGYEPIINYNKGNTTDPEKIKINQFTDRQTIIYEKRTLIESQFSWLKQYPSINQFYQKTITSYEGLLTLSTIISICKKI